MSSADWWAKKLGQPNQQSPQPRTPNQPVAPSQQPMTRFEPIQPQRDITERAASARQTETCPDCGSGNYMSVAGAKPRCYDCGYPLEQSGSKYGALAGAHVEGDTQAARGNDQTNNYNPQQIIGRIDG